MTDGLHEVAQDADGWRRLHPLTILKEIGSLAWAIVAAFVLDFSTAANVVSQLHADAVFVLVGLGIAALVYARVFARPQQRSAIVFALLILLQGLIGFVQFFTGLPIALVIAHMFGSALLLIGATWQVLVATETDRSRVDA